jgi:hypothetical protein
VVVLTILTMILMVVTRSLPRSPYDQWQLVWLRMLGDLALTDVGLITGDLLTKAPNADY